MFGGCGKPTFPLCRFLYWARAHHIKGYGVLKHMNEFLLKLSTSIITCKEFVARGRVWSRI